VIGVVAFGYAALCVPFLTDPYVMDESVFMRGMRAVARRGIPYYYKSAGVGWEFGLWHPPTYIYYLGGWVAALGDAESVTRGATALFTVVTVPLTAALAAVVARARGTSVATPVILAPILYVVSPLTVQNGTLIDIDGSLLTAAVVTFLAVVVWVASGRRKAGSRSMVGAIVIGTAAISAIKFGVLPVLLGSTLGYLLIRRGPRTSFLAGLSFVGGFAVFSAAWYVVAAGIGLDFAAPYVHNFGMLLSESGGGRSISTGKRFLLSGWTLYTEVLWLSPPILALALLSVLPKSLPRSMPAIGAVVRRNAESLLLLAVAIGTVVQYAVLAKMPYGFPKYVGVASPLLAVLASIVVEERIPTEWLSSHRLAVIGAVPVVGLAAAVLLGDPFLAPFDRGIGAVVRRSARTVGAYLVIAAAVAVAAALRASANHGLSSERTRSVLVAALVITTLGVNAGVLAVQADAEYSTRYYYGQEGIDQTIETTRVEYSELPVDSRSAAVIPIDISYYLSGPFTDLTAYSAEDHRRDPAPLVVTRTDEYYRVNSPVLETLLADERYRSVRHGSFVVFIREDVT